MTDITARAIVAGGIAILGNSCCRSSCRQRNCRSAITCYWGNPRYGAFIAGAIVAGAIIVAGVIAIWGAKLLSPHTEHLSPEHMSDHPILWCLDLEIGWGQWDVERVGYLESSYITSKKENYVTVSISRVQGGISSSFLSVFFTD